MARICDWRGSNLILLFLGEYRIRGFLVSPKIDSSIIENFPFPVTQGIWSGLRRFGKIHSREQVHATTPAVQNPITGSKESSNW